MNGLADLGEVSKGLTRPSVSTRFNDPDWDHHDQKRIGLRGKKVDVDAKMSRTVQYLDHRKAWTNFSCQGGKTPGGKGRGQKAYITFDPRVTRGRARRTMAELGVKADPEHTGRRISLGMPRSTKAPKWKAVEEEGRSITLPPTRAMLGITYRLPPSAARRMEKEADRRLKEIGKSLRLPDRSIVRLRSKTRTVPGMPAAHADEFEMERVSAYRKGENIGFLQVHDRFHPTNPGEIEYVVVKPGYRRKGVASAMLDRAQAAGMGPRHSAALSADGRAWKEAVGRRRS